MFLSNMKDRGSVSVQFVRGDENHVEGDIGILHPHIDLQRHPEIEQHAGVGGQLFAALQALGPVRGGGDNLDRESVAFSVGGKNVRHVPLERLRGPGARRRWYSMSAP